MTHLISTKSGLSSHIYFIYLLYIYFKMIKRSNIHLQVNELVELTFCKMIINKNVKTTSHSIGPSQFHHAFLNLFELVSLLESSTDLMRFQIGTSKCVTFRVKHHKYHKCGKSVVPKRHIVITLLFLLV